MLGRFADRLGIGPVVLVALDIGLDVLRRHQTHRVTEPGNLPRPEMILLVIRRDRRVETWNPLEEGADVDASVAD